MMPFSLSKIPSAIKLQKPQIPCVDMESIGSSMSSLLIVRLKNSYKNEPVAPIMSAAQD